MVPLAGLEPQHFLLLRRATLPNLFNYYFGTRTTKYGNKPFHFENIKSKATLKDTHLMNDLVKVIAHFDKFQELKDTVLAYIEEVKKNYEGYRPQIPLQICPQSNDIWDSANWLKPGMKESFYNTLLPKFEGSIIEEVIKAMPTEVCRTRIMRLKDQKTYPVHIDPLHRIHIPIISHPDCAFLFPEDDYMKNMPANGDVYWVDVTRRHTFTNWGNSPRIHLLMSIVDKNYRPA